MIGPIEVLLEILSADIWEIRVGCRVRVVFNEVALGGFDIAFNCGEGKARETPYAIGNAMWRSPEG